jgi:hypothetical protein
MLHAKILILKELCPFNTMKRVVLRRKCPRASNSGIQLATDVFVELLTMAPCGVK